MSLFKNDASVAVQSFLGRSVYSREPSLLKRLVVSDHLRNALGGEEDDGHAVAIEASHDVLIWLSGDWTDMRLEVGGVAHYCNKHSIQHKIGIHQNNYPIREGFRLTYCQSTLCPHRLHFLPTRQIVVAYIHRSIPLQAQSAHYH